MTMETTAAAAAAATTATTMSDIARKAGVSRSAVSFVLNGHAPGRANVRVSDETRRRILDAARDLHYRPNTFARAVRAGRFGMVGLLQSENASYSILPRGLLYGIHDTLAEHDLHLLFNIFPDRKLTDEEFVPKILRESSCDGLVINYNAVIPPRLVELLRLHRIPAVWVNSRHDADCVFPDDLRAGREATEHLLALGHRRIAYVGPEEPLHYSIPDRAAGYRAAMHGADLPPVEVRRAAEFSEWFPCLQARLSVPASGRPTAVVTYGTEYAFALLQAAFAAGVRVPEQLSVVTVDAEQPARMGLLLDTMLLPEHDMGREAVRMLLQKIDDPARAFAPLPLPLRLARGASATPPPAEP